VVIPTQRIKIRSLCRELAAQYTLDHKVGIWDIRNDARRQILQHQGIHDSEFSDTVKSRRCLGRGRFLHSRWTT